MKKIAYLVSAAASIILIIFILRNSNLMLNYSNSTRVKENLESKDKISEDKKQNSNVKDSNSDSAVTENKTNKEDSSMVIGERKVSLYGKNAVIGMKVKLEMTEEVKKEYNSAFYYQLLNGDKIVSPIAEINAATLMVQAIEIGNDVTVKLLNLQKSEVKKFNIKLEEMKE